MVSRKPGQKDIPDYHSDTRNYRTFGLSLLPLSTLPADGQSFKLLVVESHALGSLHHSIKSLFLCSLGLFFVRQYSCSLYSSMPPLGVTNPVQLAFINKRIQVRAGNVKKFRGLFTGELTGFTFGLG